MTAPTGRLGDTTAEARAVLLEAIRAELPSIAGLREEVQAAYRAAHAADASADEWMTVIRRRIPCGRKADPEYQSQVASDAQWERQQEMDAQRDALSRTEAVKAFDAAYAALGAQDEAHSAYAEATARWNITAQALTAAVMTTGAPWAPDPPPSGMAVLTVDGGTYGCSVDGIAYTAAAPLPDPETEQERRVIRDHALFFEHTWVEPPPPPPPAPPREPTPWDARPAASATVDPAESWAQAMGASRV